MGHRMNGSWDRLFRVRAAGLNAVQLYIPWNFHEQEIGRFNFGGDRNISRFIRIAHQNELYVLIRMGPYVCAELEFGGLPWWLIKDQAKVRLRSSETTYLRHVHRWLAALLSVLRPLLYKNGGPILMVQLENEYGSVSVCDHDYMRWLRDFVRETLGEDVVLYTTDGPTEKMLSCGAIEGTFATVDFGTQQTEANVKKMFELQRKYSKGGPPVNSEFYTTWFSMWGDKSMVRQEIGPVLKTMDYMWAENASFSLYMIHGGTSFEFWSGRETNGPVITSYDYAAPIDEAGQITPLYGAIRNWIGAKKDWPNPPLPLPKNRTGVSIQNVFAVTLGDFIALTNSSSLSSSDSRQRCIHSSDGPLNFEAFHRDHGFVWYSASLETDGKTLEVPELRDHAYVFLDGIFQGNLSVNDKTGGQLKMELRGGGKRGQRMDILVENIGRLTYPLTKTDPKGLFSPPFIDGKVISKRWVQCGVNLDNVYAEIEKRMAKSKNRKENDFAQPTDTICSVLLHEPTIFVAKFSTVHIDWAQMHTFLDSRGWGHGVALANGFNLGRYWPTQGPQLTLFVPGAVMKEQNLVVLIELEGRQKDDSFIHFVSDPKETFGPTEDFRNIRRRAEKRAEAAAERESPTDAPPLKRETDEVTIWRERDKRETDEVTIWRERDKRETDEVTIWRERDKRETDEVTIWRKRRPTFLLIFK
ncbi:hypothetical protein niasHT_015952 [Heterodera trifolii]|uniref:Beta-galactosidase n=1 Tax=Heterodera trifolii TaxID=157864 RepID=A0ABD2LC33_9BILA